MGDWNPISITRLADDDQITSPWSKTATAGGGSNTKGSYAQIAATAPTDSIGILLCCASNNGAYFLADVAIGAGGSEQVVIPNLGISSSGQSNIGVSPMFIPLLIRQGTRVAVRVQASTGSLSSLVKIIFIAASFVGAIGRSPGRYEDWGADTTSSFGTAVTAGNASKSAYTQLKASTGLAARWVILETESVTADSSQLTMDFATGAGGSEQVVVPDLVFADGSLGSSAILPLHIPQGSRVAVRVANASGTPSVKIHAHGGGG